MAASALAEHECGRWRSGAALTDNAREGGADFLVGHDAQKQIWDRSGLPQTSPTFVYGLWDKSRPDRPADRYRSALDASAVRTAQSGRLREVCGSALEMP